MSIVSLRPDLGEEGLDEKFCPLQNFDLATELFAEFVIVVSSLLQDDGVNV